MYFLFAAGSADFCSQSLAAARSLPAPTLRGRSKVRTPGSLQVSDPTVTQAVQKTSLLPPRLDSSLPSAPQHRGVQARGFHFHPGTDGGNAGGVGDLEMSPGWLLQADEAATRCAPLCACTSPQLPSPLVILIMAQGVSFGGRWGKLLGFGVCCYCVCISD